MRERWRQLASKEHRCFYVAPNRTVISFFLHWWRHAFNTINIEMMRQIYFISLKWLCPNWIYLWNSKPWPNSTTEFSVQKVNFSACSTRFFPEFAFVEQYGGFKSYFRRFLKKNLMHSKKLILGMGPCVTAQSQ